MAYVKNTWVDQEVERPKTYEMTNNPDGSVTLIDSFGIVTELGTPVNADNMNHIEDGIVEHEDRITILEEGQDTSNFLNKTQITNCLLEVPQRIKYDLTDGTLTVKAGTVVIVPYGTEDLTSQYPVGSTFLNDNFKVYDTQFADGKFFVWAELQSDVTQDAGTNAGTSTRVVSMSLTDNFTIYNAKHYSTNSPSYTESVQYYNTATNYVIHTLGGGEDDPRVLSFPIIYIQADGTYVYGNVLNVSNGMGYIGSTVWVDKGVKGLVPNGRNEDGSLKNDEILTEKLTIESGFSGSSKRFFWLRSDGAVGYGVYYYEQDTPLQVNTTKVERYFNTQENILYYHAAGDTKWNVAAISYVILGSLNSTNDIITSFNPKQPFRAADYDDIDGMWVKVEYDIVRDVDLNGSSYLTYNLSSILPNDGNVYEVIIEGYAITGTSNRNAVNIAIRSELISTSLCRTVTNANANSNCNGSTLIPIGRNRILELARSTSYVGKGTLIARAYRKAR